MRKNFLDMLSELANQENERVRVEVGDCPKYLAQQLLTNKYQLADLEREIDRKVEDFKTNLEREYRNRFENVENQHKLIWAEIEEKLGLPSHKHYSVNHKTLKVSEIID